jgi:hypothetical protein
MHNTGMPVSCDKRQHGVPIKGSKIQGLFAHAVWLPWDFVGSLGDQGKSFPCKDGYSGWFLKAYLPGWATQTSVFFRLFTK